MAQGIRAVVQIVSVLATMAAPVAMAEDGLALRLGVGHGDVEHQTNAYRAVDKGAFPTIGLVYRWTDWAVGLRLARSNVLWRPTFAPFPPAPSAPRIENQFLTADALVSRRMFERQDWRADIYLGARRVDAGRFTTATFGTFPSADGWSGIAGLELEYRLSSRIAVGADFGLSNYDTEESQLYLRIH